MDELKILKTEKKLLKNNDKCA